MRIWIMALALSLTACAAEEEVIAAPAEPRIVEEPIPALEQCAAADYRVLIGTPVADALLQPSESLRIYGETDIIIQEYLPQRTNVVTDGEGMVVRVYCG